MDDFNIEIDCDNDNCQSDNYDSDNSIETGFIKSRAQTNTEAGFQKQLLEKAVPQQLLEKALPKQLLEKAVPKQVIEKALPKQVIESEFQKPSTKPKIGFKKQLKEEAAPKQLLEKSNTQKEEDIPIATSNKTKKELSLEENFEFNNETINFFTRDLDSRKILIKHPLNSTYLDKINDSIIICLLIKIGHFKNYQCNTSKCKVGKIWNGKPIQLILNRKNNIQNDLSIKNLDLICANCYMVSYGLDIFIKKKKEFILTCTFCNFPLVNFKDSRKKKGLCISCEKQGNKFLFETHENNYIKELKETYSDNPFLNDNTNKTNYYTEVNKYKNLDSKKN